MRGICQIAVFDLQDIRHFKMFSHHRRGSVTTRPEVRFGKPCAKTSIVEAMVAYSPADLHGAPKHSRSLSSWTLVTFGFGLFRLSGKQRVRTFSGQSTRSEMIQAIFLWPVFPGSFRAKQKRQSVHVCGRSWPKLPSVYSCFLF